MSTYSAYATYKWNTKKLVFWVIEAAKEIIKDLLEAEKESPNLNIKGPITVSELMDLSNFIADHRPIPSYVCDYLQSLINDQRCTLAKFKSMAKQSSNPELEQATFHISSKFFIEALTQALEALGTNPKKETENVENVVIPVKSVDKPNSPTFLALGNDPDAGDSNEEYFEAEAQDAVASRSRQQNTPRKRKRGRGKTVLPKKKHRASSQADFEVPWEDCYIIEGGRGDTKNDGNGERLMTDYLVAVYDIFDVMMELRSHVQSLWQDVAYGNLNSAVGASVSNVAIAIIKQKATEIFADFSQHGTYESIISSITFGDIERSQDNLDDSIQGSPKPLDVREGYLIHSYHALRDFIIDYRINGNGRPTEQMIAEINDWDPSFDLQQANSQERIEWRRAYTINWLYDLVKVFQEPKLEGVEDRSVLHCDSPGPWQEDRRLFGLTDFAGFITFLVLHPGVEFSSKILLHHVFQLQCIVDSMAVCRGWSFDSLMGHVVTQPAQKFHAGRDVEKFLDREGQTMTGSLSSQNMLCSMLWKDVISDGNAKRHNWVKLLLKQVNSYFEGLGRTKYFDGSYDSQVNGDSHLSNSNANGL